MEDRIHVLKTILRELGIECARGIEERVDIQFSALERLHKNIADDDLFIKLVIANAVVSYQLSGSGERWWCEFSRYFSRNPPEDILDAYTHFLPASRTNRRLIPAKLRRLEKLVSFIRTEEFDAYYENMVKFRNDLARVLTARKDAKTIVFAVKMFGYAMRIVSHKFVPYPMEIDIPRDSRIERYTKKFTDENPIKFWRRISEEVCIPPLHIDSVLWSVLGWPVLRDREKLRLKSACENADMVLIIADL